MKTFPISRDPPEGGTLQCLLHYSDRGWFPISRDPPEGGTIYLVENGVIIDYLFPISRDPPEGGTVRVWSLD